MKKIALIFAAVCLCAAPAGFSARAAEPCMHPAMTATVLTAPTCTREGTQLFTCQRCGFSYVGAAPKADHTPQAVPVIPPTCTENGLSGAVVCAVCGEMLSDGEILPALGHSFGAWETEKPATWVSGGTDCQTCIRCPETRRRTTQKLTHLSEEKCPVGDTDMDGAVTAADSRLILRLSVGLNDGLDTQQKGNADLDKKDGVTAADARTALRMAVGLEQIIPFLNPGYTFKGYTKNNYKLAEKDGVTYVVSDYGYTLIANKTYSLPASYTPYAFQGAEPEPDSLLGLTEECRAAFAELQSGAKKDGVSIRLLSGYRSYSRQKRLYNNYAGRDGYAQADKYSARPGHSEHQTGLAMDVNSLSASFADTKEGRWLAANAHKYGFIIRYMKNTEAQTGYIYEPWHIRFVGKDLAAAVYKSGLCLEEFFGITSAYR